MLGNHQGTPTSPNPTPEGKGLPETRSKGRALQAREGIQSAELDQSTGTTPAGKTGNQTGGEPASPSSNLPIPLLQPGGAEGCRGGSLPPAPQNPPMHGPASEPAAQAVCSHLHPLHGTAQSQGWLLSTKRQPAARGRGQGLATETEQQEVCTTKALGGCQARNQGKKAVRTAEEQSCGQRGLRKESASS